MKEARAPGMVGVHNKNKKKTTKSKNRSREEGGEWRKTPYLLLGGTSLRRRLLSPERWKKKKPRVLNFFSTL
jgi:hypothetical protein